MPVTKQGAKVLTKDYADLKKNPPKIQKKNGVFDVQIYSNVSKKYISIGAEYTNNKTARADLKNFMKDHKENLDKIMKLSKDVIKESESLDEGFGADTQKKRLEASKKKWQELIKKHKKHKKLIDKATEYYNKNWKPGAAFEKAMKDLNIKESIDVVKILERTKEKSVLTGKTKQYMVTTKSGKDIVLVALNDKDAKHKASFIGDDIKKVVRINRKHKELYTI